MKTKVTVYVDGDGIELMVDDLITRVYDTNDGTANALADWLNRMGFDAQVEEVY